MKSLILKKLDKHVICLLSFFILFISIIWPNELLLENNSVFFMSSVENKMNDYSAEKNAQWLLNPFDRPQTDKFFNCWTDPFAYNSYWYVYYPPKIKESYDKTKFKLDNVNFYHSPQLGTTVTPFAFGFNNMKHRFYIGVGFLWNGFFLMYNKNATQLYGTHLFLDSVIQVEPFIDYFYNNKLRIRLTPIRHICYHMSGDILGDKSLHTLDTENNGNGEKFKYVGFEQIHASISYNWGWFNFYGGLAGAVTNFSQSNFVNLLYFYGGAEVKLPLWGDSYLIAGLHLGGNYDRLNDIDRIVEGNQYICTNSRYELTPIISAGLGIGIHDWVMGLKFDYGRSRQIYAYENMECRIGFSAYKYL